MSPTTFPSPPGDTFQFWHGAQKWVGQPEIRPSRPKSYEGGPGFYLTSNLDMAKSYAKGAGCLVEVGLSADTRWLEGHKVPYAAMITFLDSRHGLRNRPSIVDGLEKALARQGGTNLSTASLVNLCINTASLSGTHGQALARWLTEQGVDASHDKYGTESRVVVFNPKIIVSTAVHKVAAIDCFADFSDFETQRARLAALSTVAPHSDELKAPRRRVAP